MVLNSINYWSIIPIKIDNYYHGQTVTDFNRYCADILLKLTNLQYPDINVSGLTKFTYKYIYSI